MAFLYGEKSQLHNIIVFYFEFDFLTQDTSIPRELTWSCSILGLLLLGWAMLSTGFLSKQVQIFLEKTSIMRNIYYTQWWQRSRSGRGHQKSSYPLPFSLSGPGELKARTLDIKITVPVCRSIEPRLEVRKTSQNLFVRFLLFNKKNKQHENVYLQKLTSKKWISCTSVQKAPQQAHMYMHTHTHTCPHMHIYTCTWYT